MNKGDESLWGSKIRDSEWVGNVPEDPQTPAPAFCFSLSYLTLTWPLSTPSKSVGR